MPHQRSHRPWLTAALSVALLLLAPSAQADDERVPVPVPADRMDVRGVLGPIQAELERRRKSRGTWQDPFFYASGRQETRRMDRMIRRLKDVSKDKRWQTESGQRYPKGLDPDDWSFFVRQCAALHTEIDVVARDYRDLEVTPDAELKAWRRRFPGPEPIGRVPSEDALEDVELSIAQIRARGEVVPFHLLEAQRRLTAQVAEEQERAREEARRVYEKKKQEATAEILRRTAIRRGSLERLNALLADWLVKVRDLVARAQELEEQRLKGLVAGTEKDAPVREEAKTLLDQMARNREKARTFSGKHLPRYGTALQQGWLRVRTKLLKALDKAAKARTEGTEK